MLSGVPLDATTGVLQVTIRSAKGLKATKIGGGAPDPYCTLALGAGPELQRTNWKPSTYGPYWHEIKFLLVTSLSEMLQLTVFDYNEHRKDSELGKAAIDLTGLQDNSEQEGKLATLMREGKDRGQISYDLNYYPVILPRPLEDGTVEDVPITSV